MHSAPSSTAGGLLLIRGGAMGDFILTLPALRLLRRSFPGQRIEVLGTPGIVDLAGHFGLADGVRRLEDPALARFFVPGAALDPAWSAYFSSFSVVISHLFDPDTFFHDNLRRAGVETLLRGPHRPAEGGPHASQQLAAPLAGLALFLDPAPEPPFVPRDSRALENLIAVHPGSGSPRKNWGLENWAQVVAALSRETGAGILVISGEAEAAVLNAFREMLAAAGVDHLLADSLPLPELAARLARCRLFLGHDTGPAHLAAACGVPSVLAFGPSDPSVWAPAGAHVQVVRAPDGSLSALAPETVRAAALARYSEWSEG
jgi:heptosyltransferase-3